MSTQTQKPDSQKFLAVLLIFFLLVIYKQAIWDPYFQQNFVKPGTAPQTADTNAAPATTGTSATSAAPAATTPTSPTAPAAVPAIADNAAYPSDSEVTSAGSFRVETKTLSTTVALVGGRVTELRLKAYPETIEPGSPALNLVTHAESFPYPLGVYSGKVDDSDVHYALSSSAQPGSPEAAGLRSYDIATGASTSFELKGTLPDGRTIVKKLTFHPEGYFFDTDVTLSASSADHTRLEVEWGKFVDKASQATLFDPYNRWSFTWFDGQRATHKTFQELSSEPVKVVGDVNWLSMGDKYFMTLLMTPEGTTPARTFTNESFYRTRMAGTDVAGAVRIYAGPKNYELLQKIGHRLELNVNFSFSIVAAPLLWLLNFLERFFGNYALAIVALTMMVKGALYPLNSASYKSMKAMQEIAPEMKRIRETVVDKNQQQLQMMELYKKKGVNPLGGCLPMLLQMPIFIGLYSALLYAIELRHAPFALWIHDLSVKERLMVGAVPIPVMVILMVIAMLVQQWITPSTADPTQKRVMLIVPFIFGLMMSGLPAGLTLYMLTNIFTSIAQQRALYSNKGARFGLFVTLGASFGIFALVFILTKIG